MPPQIGIALVIGLFLGALVFGIFGIMFLRKWFFAPGYQQRDEEDSLYTTAQLESMRREGLIDERQYENLKKEVEEASKRRAARDEERRRSSKKTGLFG